MLARHAKSDPLRPLLRGNIFRLHPSSRMTLWVVELNLWISLLVSSKPPHRNSYWFGHELPHVANGSLIDVYSLSSGV